MVATLHGHLQPDVGYRARGEVFNPILQAVHDTPLDGLSLAERGTKCREGEASARTLHIARVHGHHGVGPLVSRVARVRVGKSREQGRVQFYPLCLSSQVDVIACDAAPRMGPGDHGRIRVLLHHLEARYGQQGKVEVKRIGGGRFISRLVHGGHHIGVIRW